MQKSDTEKPLVTFALFAYNQERFIRKAVEGAFVQTYSPLEIIISDDCSSDRTFDIMQEMVEEYGGRHKVRLVRNKENLGVGAHISEIGHIAAGKFLVVAAGDDISMPKRTEKLVDAWLRSRCKTKLLISDSTIMNREGT